MGWAQKSPHGAAERGVPLDSTDAGLPADTMERLLQAVIDDFSEAPRAARVAARAAALEQARGLLGLSRAQWAVVLGMVPDAYAQMLSGRAGMPADAQRRAWLCGVAAESLLGVE